MRGRITRKRLLEPLGASAAVIVALLVSVIGCSGEFSTCSESRTCPGAARGGAGGETMDAGATDAAVLPESSVEAAAACSVVEGGISRDPDHCGACDKRCSPDGTKARACVEGVCQPTCAEGHADCNGRGDDGCESDPLTDQDHCGACDVACAATGTSARPCAHGVCTPICDAAHRDCNHDGKDGCEIDVTADAKNCGGCGVTCAEAGTKKTACVDGVCQATCDAAHTDCNRDGTDGCEVDLAVDADNCGACGYICSGSHVSARNCVSGSCSPACVSGRGDCANPAPAQDDGCETNLSTPTDCGACGHGCAGGACSALKCQEVTVASGLKEPTSFAVDAAFVHWIDGIGTGRVARATVSGAGTTPVAESQVNAASIVADGQYAYWSAGAAVRRVRSGAVVVEDIATSTQFPVVAQPSPIAVDATYVYWGDWSTFKTYRALKDGSGAPELLFSTAPVFGYDIAVDGTNVYTTLGASIVWGPNDGSAATRSLSHPGYARFIALDSSYVYFNSGDVNLKADGIARAPKGVSDASKIVMVAPGVHDGAFTLDSSFFYYWSDALYRVPKAGGAPTPLSLNVNNVVKMLINAESGSQVLYWLNQGDPGASTGSIVKLAL